MRKQRLLTILKLAEGRALALGGIKGKLDIGKALSVEAYRAKIDALQGLLAAHATLTAQMETLLAEIEAAGNDLGDLSGRMLKAVQAQFGFDSEEYILVRGMRARDRRRTARRDKETDPAGSKPPPTSA